MESLGLEYTLDDWKRFADLVRAMRAAQSQYFDTKNYTALAKSKSLEKRVDKALAEAK